ncbi:MAG TPA: S1C family serine protease [Steroidobacteraceae bacterium]|nr:S1C family serine protease [Steroidobacteraceae bacterium]
MAESSHWAFPERLQPRQDDLRFDLDAALRSVVQLHAEVPDTAFTAAVLGTERIGHGVVIGQDGLVLTIGYLITEAQTIWLTTNQGTVMAGHALAYDQVTGFGLVLPLGHLGVPAMVRGSSAMSMVGDSVTVIGQGGIEHALDARIIARREFAGYWEYLLDDAIFTAPAHPQWGGTALVGENGQLLGIGSLLVRETIGEQTLDANMFVPIDLLEPILEDMIRLGRPSRAARPWLGMYATPMQGLLVVGGLTQGGPSQRAGMQLGDVLLEVEGEPVGDLAELLRKVWSIGPAGSEIAMTVARGRNTSQLRVRSANREDFLTKPRRH